jgi:hypothetical protein
MSTMDTTDTAARTMTTTVVTITALTATGGKRPAPYPSAYASTPSSAPALR